MYKFLYFLLLIFRLYLVFLPLYGYIHPDEFFQGPEKIAGDVFQYDIFKAWEFDESFPLRSPAMWYLICWYPFNLLRMSRLIGLFTHIDSYWLLVIPRLMMFALSFLTDAAMMKVASSIGCSPYFAGFLSSTSYVTVVFYTRTFSNSLESLFLAILLVTVTSYVKSCSESYDELEKLKANKTKGDSVKSATTEGSTVSTASEPGPYVCSPTEESDTSNTADSSKHCTTQSDMMTSQPREDSADQENTTTSNPQHQNVMNGSGGVYEANDVNKLMQEKHKSANGGVSENEKKLKHSLEEEEREKIVARMHVSRNKASLIISVVLMAGIWNRPTFLGFALAPGVYWVFQGRMPKGGHDLLMAAVRCFLNLPYVINVTLILVLFDTSYYRARSSANQQSNIHSLVDQLVVTPLNFFLYNKNSENLAEHGIHPRYLHAVVNIPLLFGPLACCAVFMALVVKLVPNKAHRSTLILMLSTVAIPLALLSIFPHQEPRHYPKGAYHYWDDHDSDLPECL